MSSTTSQNNNKKKKKKNKNPTSIPPLISPEAPSVYDSEYGGEHGGDCYADGNDDADGEMKTTDEFFIDRERIFVVADNDDDDDDDDEQIVGETTTIRDGINNNSNFENDGNFNLNHHKNNNNSKHSSSAARTITTSTRDDDNHDDDDHVEDVDQAVILPLSALEKKASSTSNNNNNNNNNNIDCDDDDSCSIKQPSTTSHTTNDVTTHSNPHHPLLKGDGNNDHDDNDDHDDLVNDNTSNSSRVGDLIEVPKKNTTWKLLDEGRQSQSSPSSRVSDLLEVPKQQQRNVSLKRRMMMMNSIRQNADHLRFSDSLASESSPSSRHHPSETTAMLSNRLLADLIEVPKKAMSRRRTNKRLSLVGSFMESWNTEVAYAHLRNKDEGTFKNVVGWTAICTLTFVYVFTRFLISRDYSNPKMHISTATWILLGGYTFLRKKYRVLVSDGDRTLYLANVVVSTAIAMLVIVFFESSCMHCAFHVVEDSSQGRGIGLTDAAEFLLVEADGLDRKTLACQACTSAFFSLFFYFMDSPVVTFAEENNNVLDYKLVDGMEEITDIVSLAHSIDELNDQKKTADAESFQRKILYEVAQNGHLDIGEAFSSYLCSPSSRVVGDTSVEFLDRIQSPRFSGESINLTVAEMSSIMRGDILKDVGVAACFILRFALFVPENPAIDHIKIESGSVPIMNEEKMKAFDATADLPGIMIPQIDPEVDQQGVAIMLTKSLMDAYVKFPFNNDPIYFKTRDEYYFFYRWNTELSIQDEWYFPNWLLKERTRDKMIDVMSKRNTLAMDILAFENPASDETLSDRVFYGTGQKFLTPIKLPGIHDDYELIFPHNVDNTFISKEHENFFRCKRKPKREDLERMIKSHYLSEGDLVSSLWDWRNRIVEVDFAVVESIPSREQFYSPGVIVYFDSETKAPIGIWESSREQMFLPTEGRNWEHAKFFFRVCERAVLASDHVIRSHFGMSQAVATASLQTLPENHGLRAFLKPYVHGVQLVNSAAYQMLVRDHSVLTHASGFTSEGVIATFLTLQQGFNFSESIPEVFAKSKLDSVLEEELPLHSQGLRLYTVHRKWVSRYLKLLYPTDEELLADEAIHRFWSHVDTYGRHLDPCVCSMPSSSIVDFEDETKWPGFESFRTCEGLLDRNDFRRSDQEFVSRRESWCKRSAYVRLKALRQWIEDDCEQSETCSHVSYSFYHMRDKMGMGQLTTRKQLIDFLATFIWDVTAGHSINSDNVSYLADPEYSGVRMREYDANGNLPVRTDIGTYIFGTSIASLTTVRCPPLMADWSHLYRDFVFHQKSLRVDKKVELSKKFKEIHLDYKHELLNLASVFIDEASYHGGNKVSHVLNPMTQASSVSV